VHQAQITACAIIQEADGTTRTEQRQFDEIMRHIEEIEARIARFDARLLEELKDVNFRRHGAISYSA